MSLCTYCHAPLAPGMQAEFNLSPLFMGVACLLAHFDLALGRAPCQPIPSNLENPP
jgi:hypothetical protein